jgi:hypothetical protein
MVLFSQVSLFILQNEFFDVFIRLNLPFNLEKSDLFGSIYRKFPELHVYFDFKSSIS